MIELTRLNGQAFLLNSDLIETIEETPDTTIRLISKNYYIVQESADTVTKKIIFYKKSCNNYLYRVISETK